jgi:hypothetical protein
MVRLENYHHHLEEYVAFSENTSSTSPILSALPRRTRSETDLLKPDLKCHEPCAVAQFKER